MIAIKDLEMTFGERVLFTDVSFQLTPGNRYGVVGANGSGKSTFMKLLEREMEPNKGSINMPSNFTLGTLKQDHFAYENERIIDTVIMGKKTLWGAIKEKNTILQKEDITDDDGHRLSDLEMVIADNDGYNAEADAAEIIAGLGIPTKNHHLPMSTLSGGFKIRVLLAQCLFGMPDCLLLDEPTNHLDIISIAWLEKFLSKFPGIIVVISHDQFFLNKISTYILDIDYQTITAYKGNYDSFIYMRDLERAQKEAGIAQQEKEREKLQTFIDRFKATASKATQAQSKKKQIERMEKIEIVRSSRVYPRFSFPVQNTTGKIAIECSNISKSFGDKKVLSDISLTLHRGSRIAVIGPNGAGKSTLLKILTDNILQDNGTVKPGHNMNLGYFPQDHHELLPDDSTPYEWLYSCGPDKTIGTIRGLLGTMLFCKDDVHKPMKALSGGEAARLIFASLILKKPNLLVLDEPTNHMDLESVEALSDALINYEGSILFVSHYRQFVQKVATSILGLKEEGYDLYEGTYQEYLEYYGEDHLNRNVDISVIKNRDKNKKDKEKELPKEKRLDESDIKQIRKSISTYEKEIKNAEGIINKLEEKISGYTYKLENDLNLYNLENKDILAQLLKDKEALSLELSMEIKEWEELSNLLERDKKRI